MSDAISQASRVFEESGGNIHEFLAGAHRVYLTDVFFSDNAKYTIGLAVKDIASQCGLFDHEITKHLVGDMYWLEESESLIIIFPVPAIEAEMLVEIPQGHWWFRDADCASH
ncbi:MAG: hypothetical protein KKE73_10665 [Proteobacteria bacterium]|nr:hypothetical protein [Pseudomonadota bacterium]